MFETASRLPLLRRRSLLVCLLGGLTLAACSDDSLPTQINELEAPEGVAMAPTGPQTALRITRSESVLGGGDVSNLQVVDQSGNTVPASELTWASGWPGVATVSSRGTVSAVSSGTAIITARRGEAIAQHLAVVVGGGSSALRIWPRSSTLSVGESQALKAYDALGNSLAASAVSWSSSSSGVASVSSSGQVTTNAPGHAIITIRRGDFVAQHGVLVVGESSSRSLQRVRGDGQSGSPGAQLPTRPTVRVVDASGSGVSGISVRWRVRSGGGSLSSSTTTTGSNGETSVAWTLGSATGEQTVDATMDGAPAVQFRATASSGSSGSLRITPSESVLGRGDVANLRVVDGSGTVVPSSELTWASGWSEVASVSSGGTVTGVSSGTVVITARKGGAIAHHSAVVIGGGSSALRLHPRASDLSVGETLQLSVTDGLGNSLSPSVVSWSSSSSGVASVSSSGRITTNAPGHAIITIRRGDFVAQHGVLVAGESPSRSLQRVRGDGQSGSPGAQLPTRPTVRVVDASGSGVSGISVRWRVRSGGGSLSSSTTTTGSNGETSVAWTLGSATGEQTVDATMDGAPAVQFRATASSESSGSLRMTRSESVLGSGDVSNLQVVDESGQVVPASELTWSSGWPGVATVSSRGTVSVVSSGTAVIMARRGQAVAQHLAVVIGGGSSALRLHPRESTLSVGQTRQLSVTDGVGNSLDPSAVSWSSSSSGVASVSSSGRITTNAPGHAIITIRRGDFVAQHGVLVSGEGTPLRVDQIRVSPGSSDLAIGESIQLQATARDPSGNPLNVALTWSSARPDIASVSSAGRVVGQSPGSTTIRVSADGVSTTHAVTVRASPNPAPPSSGEWNEPSGYVTGVDEDWNSFDDLGWYHRTNSAGRAATGNGKLTWTYYQGMSGGVTPGGPVVLEYRHGPYEYHRDEGVTLSSNFHGHQSGVNKLRFWADKQPRTYLAFFGSDDTPLILGINTGSWPMGVRKLRWDSPDNYASPTKSQAVVTRGVPHDIESLTYVGTAGNADGWLKVWLNGVLILDFRNLAIVYPGEREWITQVHYAPVWGGMGDVLPSTQTLSIDRTYVSVRP